MERNNVNMFALDLCRGLWLIHNPNSYIKLINNFLNHEAVDIKASSEQLRAASKGDGSPGQRKDEKAVFVVPVCGALSKYDYCGTPGTQSIAAEMLALARDGKAIGFVVDIDSPGGSVSSVAPLVDAIAKIKSMGLPVVAHCDSCFSAAYWIASQCDTIFADNPLSGFGSIGVFASLIDDREDKQTGFRRIEVYAPESIDKNRPSREALDGKTDALQEQLSFIAKSFISAVKAGRSGLDLESKGLFSGATFFASAAIKAGMADGYADLEQCIQNVIVRAEYV